MSATIETFWQYLNIGTQSVQELFFFCDSIRKTVYSNDFVKFFWLRYTARKKLGIYDVHTMFLNNIVNEQ